MIHVIARSLARVAAAGLLLAGCSSAPDSSGTAGAEPSSSTSAGTEPSASASPTSTLALTAAEQQAFEEATKVVLAYRQTITDLYSGARTNLNDLNEVAAGDKVKRDLTDIQQSLGDGWRYEPKGGLVTLVSAAPVDIRLTADPDKVVLRACLDTTAITDVSPAGERSTGIREELNYTLVRTDYLPPPGWAVTRVSTDVTEPTDRRC